MNHSITLIGLGKMGTAMAEQLCAADHDLTVYNRTLSKAEALAEHGATVARSIEDAVKDADVIVTSLLDDVALNDVTDEMLKHMKLGAIHISTSTILPATAEALAKRHQSQGIHYLAAPVLGVPDALRAKQGHTLCTGDHEVFKTVETLLASYSGHVTYLGETVSHANVMKISMNYTVTAAIELISELYAFAEKSGMDKGIIREGLMQIYAHPGVHGYINKIHDRDFDSINFDMRGGNKDIHLFQTALADVGVSADIANCMQGKFTEALARGWHDKDWSAVSDVVRQRSGL